MVGWKAIKALIELKYKADWLDISILKNKYYKIKLINKSISLGSWKLIMCNKAKPIDLRNLIKLV